ncbi:MAG: hypothetical protein LBS42_11180 [Tannerella sp.]|nr:hypothetical protein [Tannerella sp.]
MTDKQIAKQNMLQVVIHTLDEYESLYANIPVFAGAVTDLKRTAKEIEKEAGRQSKENRKGMTDEKQDAETTLVNRTVTAANVLSAPDFYAIYFNARNIINTAARKRKPAEGGLEETA